MITKLIFCIIALVLQPVISFGVLATKCKDKAAMRMPLVYVSGAYCVVQIYAFVKYFIKMPDKYAIPLQIVILIGFIILEILLILGNVYIKRVDDKEKADTSDFETIRQHFDLKILEFSDAEKLARLSAIQEKLKYSNPVSHSSVALENQNLIFAIDSLNNQMNDEEFQYQCNEITRMLQQRDVLNKE